MNDIDLEEARRIAANINREFGLGGNPMIPHQGGERTPVVGEGERDSRNEVRIYLKKIKSSLKQNLYV